MVEEFMNKAKVPVDIEKWFANQVAVEELSNILKSDAFQQAVATLKEASGPSYSSLSQSTEQNNLRYAWYAGYRDAFADLEKLTKFRSSKSQNLSEEWGHIDLNN